MCECPETLEMLEPMHYKQSCAYVSVPQMLSKAQAGEPTGLLEQIASATGPVSPMANSSSLMKIQRYLMSPMPGLVSIGLIWEDLEAHPNIIQLVMQHVYQRIDVQRAFHGVAQPTTASLKAIVCTVDNSNFCAFAVDSNHSWHWFDDKSRVAAGDDFSSVAAKCSMSNYQPCILIYQI